MKKIINFIKNLFNGFDTRDKKAIEDAIKIVNRLKSIVYSDSVCFITLITPTGIDDKILAILKQEIPKLLSFLNLFENGTFETALENLKRSEYKADHYDFLATQIALILSDGRLTWGEVKSVIKVLYDRESLLK